MLKTDKSKELFERAVKSLSGGVNSPVRAFKAVGGTPLYISRGEGAYIWDVDGNRYLDFCGSWGPLILGHAHPAVIETVRETAVKGTSFGTVHENEILLAEKINKLCPHIELLRFVSSGTEAVMSAVRLARGFTGRDKILKFSGCYHGHSDYLLVSAGSGLATFGIPDSGGVPADFARYTLVAPLDDAPTVEKLLAEYGREMAAVIIEPVPANNGLLLQKKEYLRFLREITHRYGALLIFDEVISGFRVGPGGAAEYYGITPDLCTYGKVVGGGLPVGAFGGRAEIMNFLAPNGPVYQAGTLSGNPLAMAAGLATLSFLEENRGWEKLAETSEILVRNLRAKIDPGRARVVNIGSIFWVALQASAPTRAEAITKEGAVKYAGIFREALEAGIYLAPSAYEVGFVGLAHLKENLEQAAIILAEIINRNCG